MCLRGVPELRDTYPHLFMVELRTHLPQANPTALALSAQIVNASASQPAHRCRVVGGLDCK